MCGALRHRPAGGDMVIRGCVKSVSRGRTSNKSIELCPIVDKGVCCVVLCCVVFVYLVIVQQGEVVALDVLKYSCVRVGSYKKIVLMLCSYTLCSCR